MTDAHAPETTSGLRLALGNRDIRNMQLGWGAGVGADAAFLVVALIVAYEAAGAIGVGILGLVRMVPATLVVLFADVESRVRPERLLVVVNVLRLSGAIIGVIGLIAGSTLGTAAVVTTFVAAGLIAGAGSLSRPTQSALIPALASEPAELVGANVATSLFEGIGTFVGPLLAGLVLGISGPAPAAALAAVGFALATLTVMTVRVAEAARPPIRVEPTGVPLRAGLRALRGRPAAAAILGSILAQVFVRGLLITLIVVVAVETLALGDPGVGGLNAALGAGGIIGAAVAVGLARRRRFAPILALSLVGWGVPIAVVGLAPVTSVAFAAMVVVGLSNVVLDVVAYTLLQRAIPSGERAAVFALMEGFIGLGATAGGLVAPVLIASAGVTGALIVTGAILPLVALLGWRRIRSIDDERAIPDDVADALRADPLLRRLPLAALERVGSDATSATFGPGQTLMREGEIGDRYLVITAGEVEVSQAGVVRRHCGPGDGIGEIALLRAVPRTATVTAITETSVLEIPCASFISAMTGHEVSGDQAATLMAERLA